MTDTSSHDTAARTRAIVAWLLVAMAVAGIADLATDSPRVWSGSHAFVELAFILLAAAAAILLLRGWRDTERSLASVRATLATRQAERDRWQALAQNALRGLGEAMDRQFDAWALTPADVGEMVVDLLRTSPRALHSRVEMRPARPPRKS